MNWPQYETREAIANGGKVAPQHKVFDQEGSELWQYSAS